MSDSGLNTLSKIRDSLSQENIRWVNPGNFHVTLRFIGDTTTEQVEDIKESLKKAIRNLSSFSFHISGIGVFRSISYPRVIWLGIRGGEELGTLKLSVDHNLSGIINTDLQENYNPHLTIGRMKNIINTKNLELLLKEYRDFNFLNVRVDQVLFYESRLLPAGPEYSVLSAYPLK